MHQIKILSIDPGGVTGWALFTINVGNDGAFHWKKKLSDHFQAGKIGEQDDHHGTLWQLLHRFEPEVLIYERFDPRENEFAKRMSLEYIGVMKLYFALTAGIVLVSQGVMDVKAFATNEKLIILDLLARPLREWKDTNDAMRHLINYLINNPKYPSARERLLIALKPDIQY